MEIEHIGHNVQDPVRVAEWYASNLGFEVKRKMDHSPHMHFLADSSGRMMLEIYSNAKASAPDYAQLDPLVLHLAFRVQDIEREKERLLMAGASLDRDTIVTAMGDQLVMLRNPWGFAMQLCKRQEPPVELPGLGEV